MKPFPSVEQLEVVPAEDIPGENVPGDHVSGKSVPGKPVPGKHVPGKPVPSKPIPGEPVPGKHVPEEAEDTAESVPTTASQSGELESVASGGSVALPRSTDSTEALAKLRPRIDPRLCPSPG